MSRERWSIRRLEPIARQSDPRFDFATGNVDDDEVLRQLVQVSSLGNPRHWVHFLPCANEATARAVAAAVAPFDWSVEITSNRRRRDWCVIAEKFDVVISPESVREARIFFEGIASHIPGADYDGWQAST